MSTNQEGTIVWGFMLENTLFTKFEDRNHALIESAYQQRRSRQSSHYIHIIDINLPKPHKAKVYFGVVQNHLRMPGTRYYVTRKVIKPTPPPLPMYTYPLLDPFYYLDHELLEMITLNQELLNWNQQDFLLNNTSNHLE